MLPLRILSLTGTLPPQGLGDELLGDSDLPWVGVRHAGSIIRG
jgi:hypothetical protein